MPQTKKQSQAFVQYKLAIGQPGDKYEKEADYVADKVMKMNDTNAVQTQTIEEEETAQAKMQMQPIEEEEETVQPKIQMQPVEEEEESVQPKIQMQAVEEEEESIQMQPKEEEEESLQMKSAIQKSSDGNQYASSDISQKLNSTKGSGEKLPKNVEAEMGNKIGADFSATKIHTDSHAVQMNRKLGAQAFTHGRDIYFNQGKYAPNSSGGKCLLAHELTHVAQQNRYGVDYVQRKATLTKPTQPGLSSHLGQFSQHPTIGTAVKSKYITQVNLLKAAKNLQKELFAGYNRGDSPLTFEKFIKKAFVLTGDKNTALLICHNVSRGFARGSDPDINVSRSGNTYTGVDGVTATLKSNHVSIFPYIFDVKTEFGFTDMNDTKKIRNVAGDWYHFFGIATAAMTGNRSDMSFKNPSPTIPKGISGFINSIPDIYTWATGEGINLTMNWLGNKGLPNNKGWRYANALSMVEGGYYAKSQKELKGESITHMRGAIRGVKESGTKALPKWKWLVPKSGCLKPILSELIRKLGGSFNGTSLAALVSYYKNPLNFSELSKIVSNAHNFNFKSFYNVEFKSKLKVDETLFARDINKLKYTWKAPQTKPKPKTTSKVKKR